MINSKLSCLIHKSSHFLIFGFLFYCMTKNSDNSYRNSWRIWNKYYVWKILHSFLVYKITSFHSCILILLIINIPSRRYHLNLKSCDRWNYHYSKIMMTNNTTEYIQHIWTKIWNRINYYYEMYVFFVIRLYICNLLYFTNIIFTNFSNYRF